MKSTFSNFLGSNRSGIRRAGICASALILLLAAGCTSDQRNNPDEIRQETAKATREVARDAKAVAQGVGDGLKSKVGTSININTATADQLATLPGINDARARRIIANRPYDHADDLVKKHVVPQEEYDRISGQIVAN
jgi:DNA uptake protein ComE-like DNA-binding protein